MPTFLFAVLIGSMTMVALIFINTQGPSLSSTLNSGGETAAETRALGFGVLLTAFYKQNYLNAFYTYVLKYITNYNINIK